MLLKHKQRGITLSGLIFGCILLGIVAVIGMKLFPLFNEKMKVDFALRKVVEDKSINSRSKPEIVNALMKQFEVSDVDRWEYPELARLLKIERKKGALNRTMSLSYEIRGPFFEPLDVVLKYNSAHDLPGTESPEE